MWSSSRQSSSKKRSGADAIDNLSVSIVGVSGSINDMTAERRLNRIQQEAHIVAQTAQAAQEALVSSPKRRQEAVERLQINEGYTVGSKTVAMFCSFGVVAMWRLTE
jgi:hypothetical protein